MREQGWSNYNNSGSGDKSEKSTNVSNRVANYYRLWANSTPELSKKYGKESEWGIITSGVSYNYVREIIEELRLNVKILKLGMTHPIPKKMCVKKC